MASTDLDDGIGNGATQVLVSKHMDDRSDLATQTMPAPDDPDLTADLGSRDTTEARPPAAYHNQRTLTATRTAVWSSGPHPQGMRWGCADTNTAGPGPPTTTSNRTT